MFKVPEDNRPRTTKNVYFYKSGDDNFRGVRLPINWKRYRTLDALLDELTVKIPDLPYGVRDLATVHGRHHVKTLAQLDHLGSYVCAGKKQRRLLGVNLDKIGDFKFRGAYMVPNSFSSSNKGSGNGTSKITDSTHDSRVLWVESPSGRRHPIKKARSHSPPPKKKPGKLEPLGSPNGSQNLLYKPIRTKKLSRSENKMPKGTLDLGSSLGTASLRSRDAFSEPEMSELSKNKKKNKGKLAASHSLTPLDEKRLKHVQRNRLVTKQVSKIRESYTLPPMTPVAIKPEKKKKKAKTKKGRIYSDVILEENRAAIKIQAHFRGYHTRKSRSKSEYPSHSSSSHSQSSSRTEDSNAAKTTRPRTTDTEDSRQRPRPQTTDTEDSRPRSKPRATDTEDSRPRSEPLATDTEDSRPRSEPLATDTEDSRPRSEPLATDTEDSRPRSKPRATDTVDSRPRSEPRATDTEDSRPRSKPRATDTVDSRPRSEPRATDTEDSRPRSEPLATDTEDSRPRSKPRATDTEDSRPRSKPRATDTEDSRPRSEPLATDTEDSRPRSKPRATDTVDSRPRSKPRATDTEDSRPRSKPRATDTEDSRPRSKPRATDTEDSRPRSKPRTTDTEDSRPRSKPRATDTEDSRPRSKPRTTDTEDSRTGTKPRKTDKEDSRPRSRPRTSDTEDSRLKTKTSATHTAETKPRLKHQKSDAKEHKAPEEKNAAKKIQAGFRGYKTRKEIKERNNAAVVIQKNVRGHLVRRKRGVQEDRVTQADEQSINDDDAATEAETQGALPAENESEIDAAEVEMESQSVTLKDDTQVAENMNEDQISEMDGPIIPPERHKRRRLKDDDLLSFCSGASGFTDSLESIDDNNIINGVVIEAVQAIVHNTDDALL